MTETANAPVTWQRPPAPIDQILNAPASPTVAISPNNRWLLELEYTDLLPIAELAEPEIAVAGFRLNPQTNGPARPNPYRKIKIHELKTDGSPLSEAIPINLPDNARISFLYWSLCGDRLAFTLTRNQHLEAWLLDLPTASAKQLTDTPLNGTYGTPLRWLSEDTLLCKVVDRDRGIPPVAKPVPFGPIVQENLGGKKPNRTYTKLLHNPHDEELFEYYVSSTLEIVNLNGEHHRIWPASLIDEAIPSPDGQYILLTTLHRPYSYQLPADYFPRKIQVIDRQGNLVYTIADVPLIDSLSTKFDAVRTGRRHVSWRSDRPSTLYWVEALDGGEPTQPADDRDVVFQLPAPFTEEPQELWRCGYRFRRLLWGREDVALAWDRWYDTRQIRMWRINPSQPEQAPVLLLERSFEDNYSDPGLPLLRRGDHNWNVMYFTSDGEGIYFTGRGASPQGVYPFLDRMDWQTGAMERIWQCQDPYFEGVVDLLDAGANVFITNRQSTTEPPNYWLYYDRTQQPIPLTRYPDPAPEFAGISEELVQYKRQDGVALSAKLYLPAGYNPDTDGPLPTIFWVYPEEYKDAKLAGQITTSTNRFSRPYRTSILFLLTQGYAVLDNPSMPIIGEGDAEPNDTYVDQLISGAKAAIDYVVDRGIADRDRIGIGGHSYGAFTTVNLLAHTDLFKIGIARSGAYNRTLTPFGFQGEQRNFWEASETYIQMSPFTHVHQVKSPLLLIHGGDDSNAGTYPIQTERLYEALKGLGGIVRWVELPLEDHSYRSQEAVAHVLWEMVNWCDTYLK
ncbi:alpha/beta hydrolase family protein [Alkalinema pantanalense CENA528]|uniref:alpha/beta hydrolase family protein n=1 Tax=Alkalinema pantanalense TaxID=1620705 RepID=UPI003D6DCD9B